MPTRPRGCLGHWSTQFVVVHMTLVKLATVILCLPQATESNSDADGSSLLFLKPGASYKGRTTTTSLESSSAAVAVLVTLENWSRWSMVEPEVQVTCGKAAGSLPEAVRPGYSEMALFEKGPGFTGVCGVLTYRMETPSYDPPHYVQVMWSVPYDYNTYNAYLAVGIANEFLNSSNLFNELYYHVGPFERVKAGNLAEFSGPELKVKLRGTMQPDTYKPIVTVSVMPVEEVDSFQFASQSAAILQNDPAFHAAVLLVMATLAAAVQ